MPSHGGKHITKGGLRLALLGGLLTGKISFSSEKNEHVPAIVPEEIKKALPEKHVQSPGYFVPYN
jgi:hypothetical protein